MTQTEEISLGKRIAGETGEMASMRKRTRERVRTLLAERSLAHERAGAPRKVLDIYDRCADGIAAATSIGEPIVQTLTFSRPYSETSWEDAIINTDAAIVLMNTDGLETELCVTDHETETDKRLLRVSARTKLRP